MLTSLSLKNFTVFSGATFAFAKGLNVIVGANGAGKSHVLKAAYTVAFVSARGERDSGSSEPSKAYLEKAIAKKLRAVFLPDALGRLVSRQQGHTGLEVRLEEAITKRLRAVLPGAGQLVVHQPGRIRSEVLAKFKTTALRLGFSFNSASKTEVVIETCPRQWEGRPPVFVPTRELLSIFPGFVSLYESTELPIDQTWFDTCLLLGNPLVRGPRLTAIKALLEPLETQLGGKVELDNGRFYLKLGSGRMEAHLVAEGMRKLAMIAQLIANGSLIGTGSLFWDEPEANLNPKVIKVVAQTILQLCRAGIQVFVASHSLFLIRELDILLRNGEFKGIPSKFFGLHLGKAGVTVQQGDSVDDIGDIDALQEELSQSDRYLQAEAE